MKLATNTEDLNSIKSQLQSKPWLVACLCAAWCDTCTSYRRQFDELAEQHPNLCFAWIDIEDQAHLVDEVEIENFPTLLIQHKDTIQFFGTMLPDTKQLDRLLAALIDASKDSSEPPSKTSSGMNQGAPAGWSLRQLLLNCAT
ncbi:thioredoxin family protein [Undibacterium sp. Jales W-56]|uniref:thioredoxin family protein n=1 Tax=Undibacterium sp. Jales W-56 TaxID=2897325 RepID=UPI0021D2E585|nr:thioredoxin family protein [Undibacterium sp. Jales W-56]MCU6433516.1 thioredoxin family protein [Undibacterium sp. Jales W-56]